MSNDLTPEQQEQIQEYAEAFRQEWQTAEETARATKTKVAKDRSAQRENIHTELDDIVPDAIAAVKGIVKHSPNESLRLNASKWVIDLKLQSDKAENDPLTLLIKDMQTELAESKSATVSGSNVNEKAA